VILLAYEDYFMRTDSKVGMSILIEDLMGEANVRAVSAGGGRGAILKLGFGANSDFEKKVEKALSNVSTGVPESSVTELPTDGTAQEDVTAGWGGTWVITAHEDRIQIDHKKKNKTMLFPYNDILSVTASKETLTVKTGSGDDESIIFDTDQICNNWLAMIEKMKA